MTHYYSHLSVVAMQLEPGATLRVGDVIRIRGHTTDFTQRVESLEVNQASVTEVGPNDDFGLKVLNTHASTTPCSECGHSAAELRKEMDATMAAVTKKAKPLALRF